jgi:hypothetical protein
MSGGWVECSLKNCKTWRRYPDEQEGNINSTEEWNCSMNTWDARFAACTSKQQCTGIVSTTQDPCTNFCRLGFQTCSNHNSQEPEADDIPVDVVPISINSLVAESLMNVHASDASSNTHLSQSQSVSNKKKDCTPAIRCQGVYKSGVNKNKPCTAVSQKGSFWCGKHKPKESSSADIERTWVDVTGESLDLSLSHLVISFMKLYHTFLYPLYYYNRNCLAHLVSINLTSCIFS